MAITLVAYVAAISGASAQDVGDEVQQTLTGASALSLTVGGGASLGAYEAGYLYYLVETLRRNDDVAQLRLATGTSAGSLNATLALIASCLPANADPESSLFYEAWTNTTLDMLHDSSSTPPMAMLSRRAMDAFMQTLRDRWSEGLPTSCDVVLGVPVTRRLPFEVSMDGREARLPRTEERFVVRLRGRGPGLAPSLENYQDVANGFAVALLPVDGDQPDEFESLRSLLYASGAFPFVFSPIPLPHCMANVRATPTRSCTPGTAVTADFVDGGFFENQPLHLAATIARTSLEHPNASLHQFRSVPDVALRELPQRTFFMQIDPHAHAFPDEGPPDAESNDVVATALAFSGHVLRGARANEINSLLESYPEVRDSVRTTQTYYPPISSLLFAFFGFVDRKLADFDFVLGMHDAQKQLEEEFFPAFARGGSVRTTPIAYPELEPSSGVAKRFVCMRAYLDAVGDPESLCAGDELQSFRAMLLVTMERLYSNCASYREAVVNTPHAQCLAAMNGDAPPDLLDTRHGQKWELPGEAEPNVSREAIQRLAAYGFWFSDLGLGRRESGRVLVRLRDRLGGVARDFVGRQDFSHQALDTVLRAGLNSLHYAPPAVVAHLVLGPTSEMGVSIGSPYGRVPFLRATFAIAVAGLGTVIGDQRYALQFAPTAGVELEPVRLSSSIFQLRLGSRVGYSFSTIDRFGIDGCGPSDPQRALCSRMIVTAYAAVSFIDVVRLQLAFTFLPAVGSQDRLAWSVGPSIGIQLRSRR